MPRSLARALVPRRVRAALRSRLTARPEPLSTHERSQLVGGPEPVSRWFGIDRGLPVDRYYIERFMERYGGADAPLGEGIRGRVLEVAEHLYVRGPQAFAARDVDGPQPPLLPEIDTVDVLDLSPGNDRATIVADLTGDDGVPSEAFDCVICTQVLQFVFDVRSAVRTLHRALRPGGVVLATVPALSQICPPELAMSHELETEDYPGGLAAPVDRWRMTVEGARALFEERFGAGNVVVEGYGNLRAAVGFLQGLAAEDFERGELDARDSTYPVLVGVCALRRGP